MLFSSVGFRRVIIGVLTETSDCVRDIGSSACHQILQLTSKLPIWYIRVVDSVNVRLFSARCLNHELQVLNWLAVQDLVVLIPLNTKYPPRRENFSWCAPVTC